MIYIGSYAGDAQVHPVHGGTTHTPRRKFLIIPSWRNVPGSHESEGVVYRAGALSSLKDGCKKADSPPF